MIRSIRGFSRVMRGSVAASCLILMISAVGAQGQGGYTAPRSGWLFVVDSNDYGDQGRLLVVDPDAGRVVWSRPTGHLPDIAIAPNGSLLYLASATVKPSTVDERLEVIDTATGQTIRDLANPDRSSSTLASYSSRMAISPSGRWLYQAKMDNAPGNLTYYVSTLDTERQVFLAHRTLTPLCVWPTILPPGEENRLDVLCNETLDVRRLSPQDPAASASRLLLGSGAAARALRGPSPATALVTSNTDAVTVVMGDGRFIKGNLATRQITETDLIDRAARGVFDTAGSKPATSAPSAAADWFAGRVLHQQIPLLSPDGSQLYVGTSNAASPRNRRTFEEIAVLDPQTLQLKRRLPTGGQFESMTLSRDGARLFLVDTKGAAIKVLDAASGQTLRTITVGTTPVFAIIHP